MFGADQEAKAWAVETLWNASLHIMGSRSFHDMAAWWPTSTDMFAPPMNQIPKAVFSRRGPAILADGDRVGGARPSPRQGGGHTVRGAAARRGELGAGHCGER